MFCILFDKMSCIIPGYNFKYTINIKFKVGFNNFDVNKFYYNLIYRLSLLNAGRLQPEIIIKAVKINYKTNSVIFIVIFKNVQDINDIKYFKSNKGKIGIKKTVIRMLNEEKKYKNTVIVN